MQNRNSHAASESARAGNTAAKSSGKPGREERIAQALSLRHQGHSYRVIAKRIGVNVRTAHRWVQAGYEATPQATSLEWARLILERCNKKTEELMARLSAGDASASVIDGLPQAQARILEIHGIHVDQPEGEAIAVARARAS